jgi:hypothetical protein
MAKLLDMLDRLSRGEELTLFDAIEALRVLMGILGGDESGDGEGGLGDDTDQFLRLLQMAQPFLGGASTAPAPVPVPVP